MSKKANPTTIGLFVVIGLALAIAGIVAFSSGQWFKKQTEFIVYFDSSLRGLNAGSSVRVSGVKVGQVKEVLIHFNQVEGDTHLPVIIEVDHKLLNSKTDKQFRIDDPDELERVVGNGLRARLQAESLVTGLLYVDLSVQHAPTPALYHQVKPLYLEIPTAPNDIQLLMENLAHLDFRALTEKLDQVLVTLNEDLAELQVAEISAGLTNLLGSLNEIMSSPNLTNALANLDLTLGETRQLAEGMRQNLDPLAEGANETLAEARTTMAEMRLAVEDLRDVLAPEAPLRRDVAIALEQIGNAARSIGDLADYLSRNPNALISGRKPQQVNP